MQLQQQQQVQLQIQLSSSPKNALTKGANSSIVDAVEDDLVKKYENEKKEKDKIMANTKQEAANNFMIFERHFEDKDLADSSNNENNGIQASA
jgi:hypothetical protein